MNDTLTLFSIRADYRGCEYGCLFIVAADGAFTATELVRNSLQRGDSDCGVEIDSCGPIGTTTIYPSPRIVDNFTT
jgi:hypothetical protein